MTGYNKRHTELYDLFYADRPYKEQADFIHRYLERYASTQTRRILELACGTGSHALILEKLGFDMTATDYSHDMIACAQRKASAAKAKTQFYIQDMRNLDVPGRPFDACICLFDSIGYVETDEGLRQTLQGVHRHLRPSGLFLFEFWHATAMLQHYEPFRSKRWENQEGEVVRIAETELDVARNIAKVTYTIYETTSQGDSHVSKETQTNRFFLVQEMADLLTVNGFSLIKSFDGFTESVNITEDTWHVVALARSVE